jgi:pyruvate formate lyase activating enzyme
MGSVFDIKRFSTHDGPGIRTTVFLKGCPLNCLWCQNPEGLNLKKRIKFFENKCIMCKNCIELCPKNALNFETNVNKKININIKSNCDNCGLCIDNCPSKALVFDSLDMSVDDVYEEVLKDKVFYNNIGGITLSGGDPLCQFEFSSELLKKCFENNINTTIETSLHFELTKIESIIPYLNLLITDFKVFNSILHKRYTCKSNDLIKDNLESLFRDYYNKEKLDILVRIPLIPGYTATKENIYNSGKYLHDLSDNIKVELINYNPLAASKYKILNRRYIFNESQKIYSKLEMESFYKILKKTGINNNYKLP